MPLGTKVVLGAGHIVLDGDPAPPEKGHTPNFRPMSVVAKRSPISATAELLLWPPCVADADIIFLPCGFFFYLSFIANLYNRAGHIYFHSVVCSFFFFLA